MMIEKFLKNGARKHNRFFLKIDYFREKRKQKQNIKNNKQNQAMPLTTKNKKHKPNEKQNPHQNRKCLIEK